MNYSEFRMKLVELLEAVPEPLLPLLLDRIRELAMEAVGEMGASHQQSANEPGYCTLQGWK